MLDYNISAPAAVTVNKGGSGTVAISVTRNPSNGFGNSIGFNATVSPSNSNISIPAIPAVVDGSTTTTMTINVGSTTTSGSYAIKVTAPPSCTSALRSSTVTLPFP